MIVYGILGGSMALALALALTPAVRVLSVRRGFLDRPGQRKVHTTPTSRLGGVAIFLAVLVPLLFLLPGSRETQGFLTGLAILATLGFIDDVRPLDAWAKLPVQILAAWFLVVFGGMQIVYLEIPGGDLWTLPGWFSNLFTVACVVAVINAMNLIDGLDGLAGGTATIIFVFIGALGLSTGNQTAMVLSAAYVGSMLGFLRYNRHPATIFMGDMGSTVVGFGLAYGCLTLVFEPAHTLSTWVPVGLLALPMFDTAWAFSRRISRGRSPFSPDRSHIHHRLLRSGLPHPKVVWVLYGLTLLLCLQTSLLAKGNGVVILELTVATLVGFYFLVRLFQLPGVHAVRLRQRALPGRESDRPGRPRRDA